MTFPIPEGDFRFVALDVETANGSAWSISQIGIACVTRENQVRQWASLVDPQCGFSTFNIRLTGIHPDHVRGAPKFPEVLAALDPVLSRAVVFQHSSFDQKAVAAACDKAELTPPKWEWMDSIRVARRAWPEFTGQGGHGLAHLKEKLGLSFNHHDAGEDARAAAEVVLRAEAKMGVDFRMIHGTAKAKKPSRPVAPPANPQGALFGAVVVFSGELSVPRAEAAGRAAKAGMRVSGRLSTATTHLVLGGPSLPLEPGQEPTVKERQARIMQAEGRPIAILREDDFHALMQRAEPGGS